MGFPDSSVGKESAWNVGDLCSIPGLGRSPGEGKGYPLQYSGEFHGLYCPWGHKELDTTATFTLSIWTFVGKLMSLLFHTLSRFVIVFLPRRKHLLISWLESLSSVILEPKKIKL